MEKKLQSKKIQNYPQPEGWGFNIRDFRLKSRSEKRGFKPKRLLSKKIGINFAQRMFFVKKWADFVSTHPDKEWSSLQKVLIDSQLQNAQRVLLSKEQVNDIKNTGSRREKKDRSLHR